MKTTWTQERLTRLFEGYNQKFWGNKLRKVNVRIAPLDGIWGLYHKRTIFVDVKKHPSDREIRSTLLHEMCHAAADRGKRLQAHGYEFWAQVEHLLRQKAPITVGFPETPGLEVLANTVPRRFPLARRIVTRLEARRQRALDQYVRV